MRSGECEGFFREDGIHVPEALESGNREPVARLRGSGKWFDDEATARPFRSFVRFQEICGFAVVGECGVGFGRAVCGSHAVVLANGYHVEFLCRGDEFGDQDFEGVAAVGGGEDEGRGVGFADEAEEFFPAAGDN